jgi:hypothetical protein
MNPFASQVNVFKLHTRIQPTSELSCKRVLDQIGLRLFDRRERWSYRVELDRFLPEQ